MKRRSIAKYAAVAAVLSLGLTACGGASGSADAKTSGTVRVTLANHVWTEGIKAAIPEFEKSSGLKVELTQLGEDQLSDQYNVKLNAGSDEIDVMMYRPLQEGIGGQVRERGRERLHHHVVGARQAQQLAAPLDGREQGRRARGCQHRHRVRIEGQRHCPHAVLARMRARAPHQRLVPEMHAVMVARRDHTRARRRWRDCRHWSRSMPRRRG